MEQQHTTRNELTTISHSSNIELGKSTPAKNSDDISLTLIDKDTRNETFRTFEDYRRANGDRGVFGKKVYFATLQDIKLIQRCSKDEDCRGSFRPTDSAQLKYPDMFAYDSINKIWGFSYDGTDEFDDKILHIFIKAARILDEKIQLQQKQDRADKAKIRNRQKALDAFTTGVTI